MWPSSGFWEGLEMWFLVCQPDSTFARCHMIRGTSVFLSFLYIKLLELGVTEKSLSTTDLRLPDTKLISSNTHVGAAALTH